MDDDNLQAAAENRDPFAPLPTDAPSSDAPSSNAPPDDTPSSDAPADATASVAETADTPPEITTGSLDLQIVDYRGAPIAKLDFKIIVKNTPPVYGSSDAKGRIATIENIPIGSPFEVHIRKDTKFFKLAAIGTIQCEENYACLKSPKTRFEFSTYSYEGVPGTADKHKKQVAEKHNQTPASEPKISGNPDTKPQIKQDRDADGKPKVTIIDGLRDWFGRNGIADKPSATASASDLEHVKRLIEFGEKQAGWKYDKGTITDAIVNQMRAGKFVEPAKKEAVGYRASIGGCNKYVKVALWYAGYGPEKEPIGSGIVPAANMGPALLSAGFQNITKDLPDGRWAAAGDVIVYKRKGSPDASGHIDIRTYDGYLSDFLDYTLPTSKFEVTGIYRKFSDPEPERRMRAFLKVLREWECHEEKDDEKRYFLMFAPINGSRRFTNTSKHPYEGEEKFKNSPAGAYQFTLGTYRDYIGDRYGIGPGFSPKYQDRLAVAYLEVLKGQPLALVRKGKVEEAVQSLTGIWSSLPGGRHARHEARKGADYVFTMDDLRTRYNSFLNELKEE